jgi:hypothetical protein
MNGKGGMEVKCASGIHRKKGYRLVSMALGRLYYIVHRGGLGPPIGAKTTSASPVQIELTGYILVIGLVIIELVP